jgi:dTDP-4-amino-4,6-dideoxygalactose transaminase
MKPAISDPLQRLAAEIPELQTAAPIIFGAPFIGEEEIAEVVHTLRSGWLGTGPKTHQFEFQFADLLQRRHAIGTNSGTAALHLALKGLEVGPGDEVITTPLTFVATANVIEHCGATPVFVDVKPHDGNIDPEQVAAAVTERTKAVIPVHYAGALADVHGIRRLLPDMPIVVDAAHCVEAKYPDGATSAGAGATCTAFSFYVTKNIVTGEGGMLVTDDDAIAARARVEGLHGLENDAWKRYTTNNGAGVYELGYAGFKYNMTDIQASLGIHQLARVGRTLARRTQLWARYNEALSGAEGIELLPVSEAAAGPEDHARHLYTILVDWNALRLNRRKLISTLKQEGIGVGWHFPPLHLQKYYVERYGYRAGMFPVAERISSSTVSLPLSARVTDDEAERITSAVLSLGNTTARLARTVPV